MHGKQNQVSACPHYLPKIYEYLYIHVYLIKYKWYIRLEWNRLIVKSIIIQHVHELHCVWQNHISFVNTYISAGIFIILMNYTTLLSGILIKKLGIFSGVIWLEILNNSVVLVHLHAILINIYEWYFIKMCCVKFRSIRGENPRQSDQDTCRWSACRVHPQGSG